MLKPGAKIAAVAPAGRFDPDRLEHGIAMVRTWGFDVVPGPNLYNAHRFFAGQDEDRASDLAWALTDPAIDAVWFARGGYGTVHTLKEVPWARLDGRPVIGFSDATALFSAMSVEGVQGAIHGPVLHSLSDHVDQASCAALRSLLVSGESPFLPGVPLLGEGEVVQGQVVGGNLCVLASLMGTPWAFNASEKIVLIEDVGEAPYRVDRLLTQLIESGALADAAGIALGSFTGCDAPEDADWNLVDVVRERLLPLNIPVIRGLPFGHGRVNFPWKYGDLAQMDGSGLQWVNP